MSKSFVRIALVAALALTVPAIAADAKKNKKPQHTEPTAQEHKAGAQRSVKGEVSRVNVDTKTVVIEVTKKKQTSELTVSTNASTEVLLDGVTATLADLKPGMKVSVQPETGVAEKISAKSLTAKEEKQNKQKKGKSEEKEEASPAPTTQPTTVPFVR
jgi:hypothetical protein